MSRKTTRRDSFNGNWRTANTSIATVDTYSTHTGQGIGSTTTSTSAQQIEGWRPGAIICPITGASPGGGDNVCATPSTENTVVHGTEAGNGPEGATLTDFVQTMFDSAGDNFGGLTVQEGNAAPGQDTCWFQASSVARVTGVTGSHWTVSGGQVSGQPNAWGFDAVGWLSSAVTYSLCKYHRARQDSRSLIRPRMATS